MPFVTRYQIQRLTPSYGTEYYDGCESKDYDGFSTEPEDAEEFRTQAKAQRRADRVGGEVCKFQRWSNLPDFGSAPRVSLTPAIAAAAE